MSKTSLFFKKNILIYGLGKSGVSSYFFLKNNNNLSLYDDNIKNIKNIKIKNRIISLKKVLKYNYDYIVISPGINIDNCNLKNLLRKSTKKIVTDLDIFYENFSFNRNIAITGTNGKSTTAQILYEILKKDKKDVRLVGNIGNPILNEKNISSKTIFVIEASSYQIEYSNIFKANYALLLNISPDHIERHGTFNNYIKSKFKLLRHQKENDYSFLDINNKFIKKEIKKKKLRSKIINVNSKIKKNFLSKIKNSYFNTDGNKQNLSFIIAVTKKLKIKNTNLFKVINKFKGLNFRQQIIFRSKKLTLINDSKSTSYASSVNILRSLKRVYWIVGGIPKLEDKFILSKKRCKHFKAYIFGNNKLIFGKELKKKMKYEYFKNLNETLKKIILDIQSEKNKIVHKTILFSPSAASFDNFKNFEDRGKKFNNLIKRLKIKKNIYA